MDRLIVTRQGSGAFVRAQTQRPVELRPHIETTFEHPHVAMDFAGLSGETLRDALSEALDKVRAGRLTPETLAVRVLLCDTSMPMALPARAETQSDDAAVRERADRITRRAASGILDQINELSDLGLIPSATVDVRVWGGAPQFKLYIINNEEVFFGFYPVVERTVTIKGAPVAIYDLLGKDVPLFHYAVTDDDEALGTQFVHAEASPATGGVLPQGSGDTRQCPGNECVRRVQSGKLPRLARGVRPTRDSWRGNGRLGTVAK
jgi:hypothetical protein